MNLIEPLLINKFCQKYEDERGYFVNTFDKEYFEDITFVSEAQSVSKKNVIRGLHYQIKNPQAKLIRVAKGTIQDILVDMRINSTNFGKVYYYELSEYNQFQLWIPAGFAHGFCCLAEENHVLYKFTQKYDNNSQSGVYAFDEQLNINWLVNKQHAILSNKDLNLYSLEEYINNPIFKI